MKVVVTGDRNWQAWGPIRAALKALPKDTVIIHGDARGADKMAGSYAQQIGLTVEAYPARWKECLDTCPDVCKAPYHPEAGPIRNREMLDLEPDVVYAFHDDLARSKGTKDCVQEAQRRKIPVEQFVSRKGITDLIKARTQIALWGDEDE